MSTIATIRSPVRLRHAIQPVKKGNILPIALKRRLVPTVFAVGLAALPIISLISPMSAAGAVAPPLAPSIQIGAGDGQRLFPDAAVRTIWDNPSMIGPMEAYITWVESNVSGLDASGALKTIVPGATEADARKLLQSALDAVRLEGSQRGSGLHAVGGDKPLLIKPAPAGTVGPIPLSVNNNVFQGAQQLAYYVCSNGCRLVSSITVTQYISPGWWTYDWGSNAGQINGWTGVRVAIICSFVNGSFGDCGSDDQGVNTGNHRAGYGSPDPTNRSKGWTVESYGYYNGQRASVYGQSPNATCTPPPPNGAWVCRF
jgi:hypothetical protein